MSAAIESLHKEYPGQYLTGVDTPVNAIYENNPHITKFDAADGQVRVIDMHYPLINRWNEKPVHFMEGYCEYLGAILGIKVPLKVNRPQIYLSDEEKGWSNQVQEVTGKQIKFWLINAGFKNCFTTKSWGHENYQAVVDGLRGKVQFVQIGQKNAGHFHKPLRGVIDLLDKTDTRQLIRLAYHSQGGLGPVTFLQHLMAAFEKPYICLLGGREPVNWVQYPWQQTLHTIGMLPCCKIACDRTRVIKLDDGQDAAKTFCERPFVNGEDAIGQCMALIRPEEVINGIERACYGSLA